MNKLTIVAVAAVSAALFGVSGAIAQAGGDFASVDGNKDGKVDMTEATGVYPGLTQAQFDQADTNKDGSLDEAEFGSLAGLMPTQAGGDNNGSQASSQDASSAATSSSAP
jgi:hypothetical protein